MEIVPNQTLCGPLLSMAFRDGKAIVHKRKWCYQESNQDSCHKGYGYKGVSSMGLPSCDFTNYASYILADCDIWKMIAISGGSMCVCVCMYVRSYMMKIISPDVTECTCVNELYANV